MLQIVIEHFENSESCESAHGFLSAAYEIKRVNNKSVRFDYRVRACLYRLIFFQCITHGFIRAYSIIAEVIVHYRGFDLFVISQGRCFQNHEEQR